MNNVQTAPSTEKYRPGDILRLLAQHPTVQRRREMLHESVRQATLEGGTVVVDEHGWRQQVRNRRWGWLPSAFDDFGLWTSETEAAELLFELRTGSAY